MAGGQVAVARVMNVCAASAQNSWGLFVPAHVCVRRYVYTCACMYIM